VTSNQQRKMNALLVARNQAHSKWLTIIIYLIIGICSAIVGATIVIVINEHCRKKTEIGFNRDHNFTAKELLGVSNMKPFYLVDERG